jgi:hypothetical protein
MKIIPGKGGANQRMLFFRELFQRYELAYRAAAAHFHIGSEVFKGHSCLLSSSKLKILNYKMKVYRALIVPCFALCTYNLKAQLARIHYIVGVDYGLDLFQSGDRRRIFVQD